MPSRQVYENIFQSRVTRRQPRQIKSSRLQMAEQRRESDVQLLHGKSDAVAIGAHFLHGREPRQFILSKAIPVRQCEFDYVLAPQP